MIESKLVKDHQNICSEFFLNIEKYVKLNALSKKTGYNWRTVRNHIQILSSDVKAREKANNELSKGVDQ